MGSVSSVIVVRKGRRRGGQGTPYLYQEYYLGSAKGNGQKPSKLANADSCIMHGDPLVVEEYLDKAS